MHVSAFMIPAERVYKCTAQDTIAVVLDEMTLNHISAVVVTGTYEDEPVGLITTADLLVAYRQGVTLDQPISQIVPTLPNVAKDHPAGDTQNKPLATLLASDSRDTAARFFESSPKRRHHALVLDAHGKFVGLVSAWDIAAEVARDARAWPWIRTDDGKINPDYVNSSRSSSSSKAKAAVH